jgi:hypothetical protein
MRAVRDIGMASPPGISPERACDVRARAWAFVFACYRKKKAPPASSPDAVKDQDPMHPSKTRGEVAM